MSLGEAALQLRWSPKADSILSRGSEPSLAGVSGQHISGSSTKVKEICSWPSEPEKAVFISSDAFPESVL